MHRSASMFLLALALGACATPPPPPPLPGAGPGPQRPGANAAARQTWASQGIRDYRVRLERQCFCAEPRETVLEVRGGRLVSVRNALTGAELTEQERMGVVTIDQLFEEIAKAEGRGDYVDVRYHATLGYPETAELGSLAADAGIRYVLTEFAPLR